MKRSEGELIRLLESLGHLATSARVLLEDVQEGRPLGRQQADSLLTITGRVVMQLSQHEAYRNAEEDTEILSWTPAQKAEHLAREQELSDRMTSGIDIGMKRRKKAKGPGT